MIAVRAVRAGEGERVRELRLRALADAPAAFAAAVDEEAGRPPSDWIELAARSESADAAVVFVAIDDGRWVGMAAGQWFDRERGIAYLWSMWVEPSARGAGLGRRPLAALRGWAVVHGARFLRLGVIEGPADAGSFYEALGFVPTGEVKPLARDSARRVYYLVRPV